MAQLKDNDFVHDLSLSSDSIQYVLASKQQLFDLECFCTGETNYSVFSVDSTFDVGEFFITNTCFENKRVVYADGRYRGKHPMMIGPSFVHTKQETHNYVNFFASIVRMNKNLRNVKAVGTDGEEALMNASLICFENATRLLCCDHKKANIESKLSDLRASEASRKHIIADIFGRRIGSTYENGLIDAETVSIFDKNCRDFKATWDFLVPVFHSWFVKYESELFRKHLIRGVCKSANIDGTFSNNRIESVHKVMKDWLGRKEKISMPVVNSKIKDLLKSDNQEFELTVYGQGAYDLSPDFKYLRVERHEWNSFNQTERQAAIDKFWKSKLKQSTVQSVDYGPSTVTTGSFPSPYCNDSPRQQIITGMSLEFDTNMQISGVTHDHFEEMWKTADLLTAGKDTIVKAPGYDGCFVQHALDVVAKPHLVTVNPLGHTVCNDCPVYQTLKICPHALAGADFLGFLRKFLQHRDKVNISECAVSDLVFENVKGGRKKTSKPRRGGRTPLERTKPSSTVDRASNEEGSDKRVVEALDNLAKDDCFQLIYLFQIKASVCYGCSEKFNRESDQNHLIVRIFCQREFTHGGEKKRKMQYAYFHMKKPCIQRKFPEFKIKDLTVADESKDVLSPQLTEKLSGLGIAQQPS